jgi:P-type Ca2+ transporter type 2C
MQTELGHIAGLARAVRPPRTPLQQGMRDLTRWLVWFALGASCIVPVLGVLLSKQPVQQMVLTGLSLAFAVIPEELPIIITMVLALGGYRLAHQHAIVKRLQAVETLGAITVIATDKTGTLTQNRMEIRQFFPDRLANRLLVLGGLCSSAMEDGPDLVGDPVDMALLRGGREAGIDRQELRHHASLHDEFTFDTIRKRMAVVYSEGEMFHVVVKGAPEAILACSTHCLVDDREQTLSQAGHEEAAEIAAQMAASGLYMIALAEKRMPAAPHMTQKEAESNLTFVGFIGLIDPPRPQVKEAIAACRAAGVRPIMITGDHPLTARTIAEQIGLNGQAGLLTGSELEALSTEALTSVSASISVYARTTPEQKLRIVQALHARGERVAVTGDGINDAPALAAADIGVAMGETGTDVAREAADMVLADDNFTTIVRAMKEGCILFANLKKGVRYYLACKVALISATLLPVLLRVPVPFAPVQIILMELFMDLAASVTFVNEPPESDLMHQPPRNPQSPFMDRGMVSSVVTSAAGLFAAVSLAYLVTWYLGGGIVRAQTVAFVTWLLGHVLLALNMRSEREPLLRLGFFSNRLMVVWGCATLIFILLAVFVPGGHLLLKTVTLASGDWLLIIPAVLVGTFWLEVRKLFSHLVAHRVSKDELKATFLPKRDKKL